MSVQESITRTLKRIGEVASFLNGPNLQALYSGIAEEFKRVNDYRKLVECATVPSANLYTEALDDLEKKYGIFYLGDVSTEQRISRVIERASLYGAGGPEWINAQIQAAGFQLYVIENVPGVADPTQFGNVQFDETTQFATMPKRVDPTTVTGILITSSAYKKGGTAISGVSQFGLAQFGSDTQFGTPNANYVYPQPAERTLPTDPTKWGRVFFLSPFPDRLATSSEILYLSSEQLAYLKKLVIQIKFLRNWCVAQVAEFVVPTSEDGLYAITSEDDAYVIQA